MFKTVFNLKSRRFLAGVTLAIGSLFLSFFLLHSAAQGCVFAALFVLAGAVQIKEEDIKEKKTIIINLLWLAISSLAVFFFTQFILNETLITIEPKIILLNMILCMIVILLFFVISLSSRISISIAAILLNLFTTVNYFIFLFRGSELAPADILSFKTAASVAADYKIPFVRVIYYAWMLTFIYIFLTFGLPRWKIEKKLRARLLALAAQIALVFSFFLLSKGVSSNHWLQTGSVRNGYILNFMLQWKETFVQKPDNYSYETIDAVSQKYHEDADSGEKHPDIIVIMDESFADLGLLGDEGIRTNTDVTPFVDSLSENAIKGYALSSVFGGGTPNSEFEFLTGNSYMFLPYGSIAFQQYMNDDVYTLMYQLKELNYHTIGLHPYVEYSWMRNTVYPLLGFDESFFIDDFPQENMMRLFESDQEMFDFMIDLYNDRKAASDESIFMFGVTMQNHGSYRYEGDENYEKTIELTGYEKDYPEVEQYLSLIHATDIAVENLLAYLEGIDNDVIVVFFGDHLPKLPTEFYEEVHGGTYNTLDEKMLQYTVPFFIWTNYDIEEQTVELTSLNFLSNYVLETAGISLPAYNQYLQDVNQVIPAMDSNGYYSLSNGRFITFEEAEGEEADVLNTYCQVQYNNLFDEQHKNRNLFPASE